MVIAAFTVLAITANIAFAWPQAIRLVRSRDTAGVSPGTWTVSVLLFATWAAYAAATHYWALLVANMSCLAAAILIMTIGTRAGWPARWAACCAAGIVAVAACSLLAPLALVIMGTTAGVALRIPQLVLLLRSRSTSGVSATTWVLSGATAACWLVVSLANDAIPVAIANATAVTATLALLAVLAFRRASEPKPPLI